MDPLKLSELIGQAITDLRFHYVPENEYGLQSFYCYIKISNDIIIGIPKYSDDNEYMQLTPENTSYFKKMFDTGELVSEEIKSFIVGQKIVDFYFSYFNDEVDIDNSAFIKLTNGNYLSENNSGPVGVTNIGLIILNETQFAEEIRRLNAFVVEMRSFIMTNNAC